MRSTQEYSWLRFNRRVLEQTRRPDFPVLERLRFLAIWATNLDEFFSARIARPFNDERGTPAYKKLLAEAREQSNVADDVYDEFLPELKDIGIRIVPEADLTREERNYFGAYLAEKVVTRTDVMAGASLRDMVSRSLYFAAGEGVLEHLVRLPAGVKRLLEIPGRPGTFIRIGELLRARSDLLFGKALPLHELRMVRLTSFDQATMEWDELPAALESRLEGKVCHLEVERGFPPHWTESIRLALGLEPDEVFQVRPPLDPRFVSTLVDAGPAEHKFEKLKAWVPPRFERAPFDQIDRGDVMLFHPYQGYEAVEAFAHAAATDPEVSAIRMTLYRVGDDNVLAQSLIDAAKAGKDVAVLLEARARFDELQNLEWGLRFQNSGVKVLELPEKKVHAKVFWVRRGRREYVHLGTGNYNTRNGRAYTDFSLFTADRGLTGEARAFFEALEEGAAPAPRFMRTGKAVRKLLLELIAAEARPGGHMVLKFNHMTDPAILSAVAKAARAGARVDLLVRTTLTELAPGVRARSIVGRFLEHARVAAFRAGGQWKVLAGSLDAMPRNFDTRFELFFPVTDLLAKKRVLSELAAQLADDVNAFDLLHDGSQLPRWGGKVNSQAAEGRRRLRSLGEPPRSAKGRRTAAGKAGSASKGRAAARRLAG
ncbi:MAG: phospholipase D-like domain-containing protein [Anaeromyxobacter sp.]